MELPYLVLLISGGHCILALAESVDKFLILGESIDSAPGQVLDKVARRFKLHNIKKFRKFNGGALLEKASLEGNPFAFPYQPQLVHVKDCNFAWSGLLNRAKMHCGEEEEKYSKLYFLRHFSLDDYFFFFRNGTR